MHAYLNFEQRKQDGTALSELMSYNYSYFIFSYFENNFSLNKITKLVFKCEIAQLLIFPL